MAYNELDGLRGYLPASVHTNLDLSIVGLSNPYILPGPGFYIVEQAGVDISFPDPASCVNAELIIYNSSSEIAIIDWAPLFVGNAVSTLNTSECLVCKAMDILGTYQWTILGLNTM